MTSEGSDEEVKQVGTFEIFKAEGDILRRQKEYKKAIDSYTTVSLKKNSTLQDSRHAPPPHSHHDTPPIRFLIVHNKCDGGKKNSDTVLLVPPN